MFLSINILLQSNLKRYYLINYNKRANLPTNAFIAPAINKAESYPTNKLVYNLTNKVIDN